MSSKTGCGSCAFKNMVTGSLCPSLKILKLACFMGIMGPVYVFRCYTGVGVGWGSGFGNMNCARL